MLLLLSRTRAHSPDPHYGAPKRVSCPWLRFASKVRCCCSTQRAHTLRAPKHRSHYHNAYLLLFNTSHNAHSPDPEAQEPLSQYHYGLPGGPEASHIFDVLIPRNIPEITDFL